ncbi:MAG: hypothetical protein Q9172_006763 [Xanthocarpia lactea]
MRVNGRSMYPFFNTDMDERLGRDIVGVSMWNPLERVRRGDVVVFRSPANPDTVAVKRVIALEGDTVVTRDPYPIPRQEVSLGHVWVEGEHPEHTRWSYDSNTYGAVCVAYSIPTCPIVSRKVRDLMRAKLGNCRRVERE